MNALRPLCRLLAALAVALGIAPTATAAEAFPAVAGRIVRLDPRLDALLPPDARLEEVYYSDIPANAIYRWRPGERAAVFVSPSGYSGSTPFAGREPGSNGLALDAAGRLVICEHGDRRITRLESDGSRRVLVDRYRGRRLNSPNDAIYSRAGDLYFTPTGSSTAARASAACWPMPRRGRGCAAVARTDSRPMPPATSLPPGPRPCSCSPRTARCSA